MSFTHSMSLSIVSMRTLPGRVNFHGHTLDSFKQRAFVYNTDKEQRQCMRTDTAQS